jgi:glyoxylase-like metal-dependent hydrolase (beta-lactamase superfamily II)
MLIYKIVVGALATNCYIVVSDRGHGFIIDPGDDAEKIKEFIAEKNIKISFIVNTHGHIDHIKADAALGYPVYVHKNDEDMIVDPAKNLMTAFFGDFDPVEPARLLKEDDVISCDGMNFKVIHTPGHTPGCICLLSGDILFSGDTLFKHGIGRTDFPGASGKQMQASLQKLALLDDRVVVYPGHGHETSIGAEFQR